MDLSSTTLSAFAMSQVGTDEGEKPIESVPADGTPPSSPPEGEEVAVLLIALPVVLLAVGAILHVVKRPAPGAEDGPRHLGGLVMMGIGGTLTFAMLLYLILAQ